MKDVSVINADVAESKYFEAGEASADFAIQVLGNIPDVQILKWLNKECGNGNDQINTNSKV